MKLLVESRVLKERALIHGRVVNISRERADGKDIESEIDDTCHTDIKINIFRNNRVFYKILLNRVMRETYCAGITILAQTSSNVSRSSKSRPPSPYQYGNEPAETSPS